MALSTCSSVRVSSWLIFEIIVKWMADATIIWVVKFPWEAYKIRQIFFSQKISVNLGKHYLITSTFETLYFLKWCPIFDGSSLCLPTKYNHLLWHIDFWPKIYLILYPFLETREPILPSSIDCWRINFTNSSWGISRTLEPLTSKIKSACFNPAASAFDDGLTYNNEY